MPSRWSWKINQASQRLDRALVEAITSGEGVWEGEPCEVSRSQLQRLIEQEKVLVNGTSVRSNTKLVAGCQVEILFPEPEPIDLVPEKRELEILFEDEYLLVINKPQGLTVHPSSTQKSGTLVHALLHHIQDLSGIGGQLRPGIVHRIDKDTSGALVITKSDLAHRRLVEIFSKHQIERIYWALCYSSPTRASGQVEGNIGRSPENRKKMTILKSGGKPAITLFRKIEEYSHLGQKPFASWLEVQLYTGRTHQVRVHLTSIHHSILGDPTYGAVTSNQPKWKSLPEEIKICVSALPGQALHARVLGFDHPITGKPLRFEAKPPILFQNLKIALESFK